VFQKGFVLPSWWFYYYCAPEFGLAAINDIARLGAEWIQLVPTWYQEHRNANQIQRLEDKTSTDACLQRAITAAHNSGLSVMLKPHVDSLDGYHRGEIAPSAPSQWFPSYEEMLLHYADMAHTNGVEIFVVGTELKSLAGSAYSDQWQTLIARVRQRYFNRLAYAANWDNYDRVDFWPALDYVGIDAYFPLSSDDDPALEELLSNWRIFTYQQNERRWLEELASFATTVDRPVIFTEIGYASQDGAAKQPWSQDNSQNPNERLQDRLYEATLRTFWNQPRFMGFYWWLWDMQPDERYLETGFHAKEPARQQIERWYALDPPEMPEEMAEPAAASNEGTPTLAVTETPTLMPPQPTATRQPAPSFPALSFDWNDCTTQGWVAQTYVDSQGITGVAGSGEVARSGACSLRLDARLVSQHDNYSKGETYVQLPAPIVFSGQTISCWVYAPSEQSSGSPESLNGAQVFVKDSAFESEYGSWFNLSPGWNKIDLMPSRTTPENGGFKSPDFDPGDVLLVGVKIGTGGQAPGDYVYDGPLFVDDCSIGAGTS
jgi:hypothetical protein